MYMALITESYWKENYKKFKHDNISLSLYIKEEIDKHGYKSKLLTEIMLLNESNNISKAEQILDSLETSVDEEDLNSIQNNVNQLDVIMPNSVKRTVIPREEINKVSNAIYGIKPTNQDNSFLNKIKRIAKYLVNNVTSTIILITVLAFLLYMLFKNSLNNQQSFVNRHNFQETATELKHAFKYITAFGAIYLIYKVVAFLLNYFYPNIPNKSEDNEDMSDFLDRI